MSRTFLQGVTLDAWAYDRSEENFRRLGNGLILLFQCGDAGGGVPQQIIQRGIVYVVVREHRHPGRSLHSGTVFPQGVVVPLGSTAGQVAFDAALRFQFAGHGTAGQQQILHDSFVQVVYTAVQCIQSGAGRFGVGRHVLLGQGLVGQQRQRRLVTDTHGSKCHFEISSLRRVLVIVDVHLQGAGIPRIVVSEFCVTGCSHSTICRKVPAHIQSMVVASRLIVYFP